MTEINPIPYCLSHLAQRDIVANAEIVRLKALLTGGGKDRLGGTGTLPVNINALADRFVLDVCELPDRTSPEDWPEAMLITGVELHAMLLTAFQAVRNDALREVIGD